MRSIIAWASKNKHQVENAPLYHQVLHVYLFEGWVFVKAILDNYKDLTNLKEHV
jgi:hypothetical protein